MPRAFLKSKVVQVFHQDSPGVRVYVRRGWLKRLIFSPHFSHIGEHHLTLEEIAEVEDKALEMATIFHSIYERHAPLFGYSTRPQTRVFSPNTPNGKLMVRTCFELITGGYRLNEPVEVGKLIGPLVAELKLPQIDVSIGDPPHFERVRMSVVEGNDKGVFTLVFNDGQQLLIGLEKNPFDFTPAEKTRVGSELSDFLNAQLYSRQEALRVVSCEHQWTEHKEEGHIYHTARQTVSPSIWESTLADSQFVQSTPISRPA